MCEKIFLFLFTIHFLLIHSSGSFAQQKNSDAISSEQQYFDSLFASDEHSFQRNFELPFLLLLDGDQEKSFLEIDSLSGRKLFIASYWKKNNPDPILYENDWLLDFIGRCNYVKENFACSEPPFFDDRGKYYLKYGAPANRFRDSGGRKTVRLFTDKRIHQYIGQLYSGFRPSQYYWVYPNESWVYRNIAQDFIIHFIKESTVFREVNSLTKALSTGIGKNVAWYWNDMIQTRAYLTPTLTRVANELLHYEHELLFGAYTGRSSATKNSLLPHKRIVNQKTLFEAEVFRNRRNPPLTIHYPITAVNTLNFINDIAQFRGRGDSTRVEILFLAPFKNNIFHRQSFEELDTISIEFQTLMRDSLYNPLAQTRDILSYPKKLINLESHQNAVSDLVFLATPQRGDLTLQIKQMAEGRVGYEKKPITIRDFTSHDLMISDIQFFREATPADDTHFIPIHEKNSIKVIPYPYLAIRKTLPVFCYFEIYNIKTAGIDTEFEITLKVLSEKQRKGIFKKFFKWLTGSKQVFISIVQPRSVTDDNIKELIAIDFRKLTKGDYRLEITVTDPRNKSTSTTAQKQIVVSDE
ncbi:MAG: GWxTD domain-containing protein [Candidatus Hodarchaeota archaeon]